MTGDRRAWTADCPSVDCDPRAVLIRRHTPDRLPSKRHRHGCNDADKSLCQLHVAGTANSVNERYQPLTDRNTCLVCIV